MGIRTDKGYTPKKRGSRQKRTGRLILIATEGKNQTETLYFFDMGKEHNLKIQFAPGNETDPVNMSNKLINKVRELKKSNETPDAVFCVVDSDTNPDKDRQLKEAEAILRKENIPLIVSSPCFEIWFLCHFKYSMAHFNSNQEVIDLLLEKMPNYSKSRKGVFEELSLKTQDAIMNAKRLEKACLDAGYRYHTVDFSPSTDVYKVVQALLNESRDY